MQFHGFWLLGNELFYLGIAFYCKYFTNRRINDKCTRINEWPPIGKIAAHSAYDMIVGLVFSHLGFWSGNLFLIAPFSDLCLLVPFDLANYMLNSGKNCISNPHFPSFNR